MLMLQLVKSAEHTPEEDTAVHAGGAGVAKWRMSATQNTKIDKIFLAILGLLP
tara:strand:+ start:463 stop:621 length:159 start_codon:yes stop_codon:yes gene_type:complete